MTNLVKVSEFRNEYDHLFRLVNVDFHSCFQLREYQQFGERLKVAHARVATLICKRASSYDLTQFDLALKQACVCMIRNENRILIAIGGSHGHC